MTTVEVDLLISKLWRAVIAARLARSDAAVSEGTVTVLRAELSRQAGAIEQALSDSATDRDDAWFEPPATEE